MLGPRDARSRRPSAIYQTVSERLSDKWGAAGTMAYASAHENISYRSFRRAVQPHRATPTCRQPAGTPQDPRSARDLNAVFYVLKSGCPWRLLPREFPPWRTVYHWFRAWRINGRWERLNAALRERLRARLGRTPQPSAGIVDSQSVKTTGVGGNERGFDPAKKVEGRKRHLLVDTEGF